MDPCSRKEYENILRELMIHNPNMTAQDAIHRAKEIVAVLKKQREYIPHRVIKEHTNIEYLIDKIKTYKINYNDFKNQIYVNNPYKI